MFFNFLILSVGLLINRITNSVFVPQAPPLRRPVESDEQKDSGHTEPSFFYVGTLYSSTKDRGAYLYARKYDFLRGYEYKVVMKDSIGLPVEFEVKTDSDSYLLGDGAKVYISHLREYFTLYRRDAHSYRPWLSLSAILSKQK